MSTRTLTIVLAVLALFLSLSWWARTHFATKRCESFGKIYEPGRGCVDPAKGPPIFLERGLKRT